MTHLRHALKFVAAISILIIFNSDGAIANSVVAEWKALPPKVYKCMKKMAEAVEQLPLERIIAAGVRPSNPAYAAGLTTCKTYANLRTNFECDVKDASGNQVHTLCNEYFVVNRSGSWSKVSADDALDMIISRSDEVRTLTEETPEGLSRRQQEIAEELKSAESGEISAEQVMQGECKGALQEWRRHTSIGSFAAAANGACGYSYDAPDQTNADSSALSYCKQRSKGSPCSVIARINEDHQTTTSSEATSEVDAPADAQQKSSASVPAEPSSPPSPTDEAAKAQSYLDLQKKNEEIRKRVAKEWKKEWAEKQHLSQSEQGGSTTQANEGAANSEQAEATQAPSSQNVPPTTNPPSPPAPPSSNGKWKYEAIFSCGMGNGNINVLGCFAPSGQYGTDTELSVERDGQQTLYKIYQLAQIRSTAGSIYAQADSDFPDGMVIDDDGLHVLLPEKFSIKAQNSSPHLILSLVVKRLATGQVVHQEQVGESGVVGVANTGGPSPEIERAAGVGFANLVFESFSCLIIQRADHRGQLTDEYLARAKSISDKIQLQLKLTDGADVQFKAGFVQASQMLAKNMDTLPQVKINGSFVKFDCSLPNHLEAMEAFYKNWEDLDASMPR